MSADITGQKRKPGKRRNKLGRESYLYFSDKIINSPIIACSTLVKRYQSSENITAISMGIAKLAKITTAKPSLIPIPPKLIGRNVAIIIVEKIIIDNKYERLYPKEFSISNP